MSLHQNITHGFDVFVTIIWFESCFVPTRVVVIKFPPCAKPDSGITPAAVILPVTDDADSCFGMDIRSTHSIEPFLVTVAL